MNEGKEKILHPESEERKIPEGMVESRKDDVDLPPGVETWMRKVEKGTSGQAVVNDTQTGQAVMTTSDPSDPVVVLPVTRGSFSKGFKLAISEAGRWISVFVFRLIKMKKGKVEFKKE